MVPIKQLFFRSVILFCHGLSDFENPLLTMNECNMLNKGKVFIIDSSSSTCVRYIHKYVHMVHGRPSIVSANEIREYVDARYICPRETSCCIFGHSLHNNILTDMDNTTSRGWNEYPQYRRRERHHPQC